MILIISSLLRRSWKSWTFFLAVATDSMKESNSAWGDECLVDNGSNIIGIVVRKPRSLMCKSLSWSKASSRRSSSHASLPWAPVSILMVGPLFAMMVQAGCGQTRIYRIMTRRKREKKRRKRSSDRPTSSQGGVVGPDVDETEGRSPRCWTTPVRFNGWMQRA